MGVKKIKAHYKKKSFINKSPHAPYTHSDQNIRTTPLEESVQPIPFFCVVHLNKKQTKAFTATFTK